MGQDWKQNSSVHVQPRGLLVNVLSKGHKEESALRGRIGALNPMREVHELKSDWLWWVALHSLGSLIQSDTYRF